jgi:hypothetical protein
MIIKTNKGTYRCKIKGWNAIYQGPSVEVEVRRWFLFYPWWERVWDEPLNDYDGGKIQDIDARETVAAYENYLFLMALHKNELEGILKR